MAPKTIAEKKDDYIQSFLSRRFSAGEVYFIATAGVLIAFVLRFSLHGLLDDKAPFTFFIPPILVAALIGGMRASLFAVALSVLAAYIIKELTPRGANFSEMAVIAIVGVVIALVGEILHTARKAIGKAQTKADSREAHLRSVLDTVLDASIVSTGTARSSPSTPRRSASSATAKRRRLARTCAC